MGEWPRYSRFEILLPWAVIPWVTLYLALGQAAPIAWERFGFEVAACIFSGVALGALESFPRMQRPIWAVTALLMALAVSLSGGGAWVTLVYLGAMTLLLGAGSRWLGDRWRVPGWACALGVVPLLLVLHLGHRLNNQAPGGFGWLGDLRDDLTWPLHRPTVAPAQQVGPPIIVISVDTLRADAAAEMQSVKRLKQGGAYWSSVMSTSSWTLPALASIQTGVMPGEHGAGCLESFHCQGLQPTVRTVAEDLRAKGYRTAAVNSNPWAGPGNGLQRGFDWFVDLANQVPRRFAFAGLAYTRSHHQDGSLVVDLGLQQLDALEGGSFYLWIHALDPHMPYLHTPEFETLTVAQIRDPVVLPEAYRQRIREAYAKEVAAIDAELMRLLDALEAKGLLDEVLVIFTSDHGEEFWEHGSVEHGHSHHGEVVEVPLVIRGPGVTPGPREGAVSLLDIASTVRAAAGVGTEGVDLRTAGTDPDRVVTAQGNLQLWMSCSARDQHSRVIVDACQTSAQRMAGYDLDTDPGERWPQPAKLGDPVRDAALSVKIPEKRATSAQNTEALKALGYMD